MKKIIVSLILVFGLSTSVVFAASLYGEYKGLEIVKVTVNEKELKADVPAVVLDGRTLLPARAVAESVGCIVNWDQKSKTANIINANASIVLCDEVVEESDGSWTIKNAGCNIDSIGEDAYIYVFGEIGPMEKQLYSYRCTVYDPKGEVFIVGSPREAVIGEDGLMMTELFDELNFSIPENYSVQLQLQYNGTYQTIAEKILTVK